MNQPNLPVMAPRTVPVAETQDVLSLVRRYIWLLIAGAVVGTATATGFFFYELKTNPRYTASIPFSVLPPPREIGREEGVQVEVRPDDMLQVLHRQEFYFEQDALLLQVLASDEFHTVDPSNPDRRGDCQWLVENKKDPIKALKRDLVIEPKVSAATFDLTMRTRDPKQSMSLVMAASRVYLSFLAAQSSQLKNASLEQMDKAVRDAESAFNANSLALETMARQKGIDVLKSRFEVEKAALQGYNEDYMKADAAFASAEAQFRAVTRKRVPTTQEAAGPATQPTQAATTATAPATGLGQFYNDDVVPNPDMQLTPDMQQYVDNDPTLRSLQSQRLGWEQEMAAELSKTAPSKQTMTAIEARLAEIDKQIARTKARLHDDALQRMVEMYRNDAYQKHAVREHIGSVRTEKESTVKSLGMDLMLYQQKVDDLKEEQTQLNKMRAQRRNVFLSRYTDDTRIQQVVTSPAPPDEAHPSWPKWYMFIPLGTLGGLGLSALLAYLLTLTDTRVRTPRDITRTLQLPLLGFVPDESDDRLLTGEIETAILSSPASMVAESFRQIRSHVTAQTAHNPANTMLIASVTPGGGSTTVAANFAASMALNDLRVLLVDANLYRPSFERVFKGIPAEGLSDAIASPETAASTIVPHPSLPTLHLMGAGSPLAGRSSEVFESKAFRELLEQLKSRYDLIVFDGAPLNLVSDSIALGARVDGVVPVVRAGEVSRGAVTRIREQLRGVHANLLGFVLNAAQTSNTGYFKENYRSFYRYAGKNARRDPVE
jgi:capsular exopolysaccharide synthesis family protein